MNEYRKQIEKIVKKSGGFREKSVIASGYTVEKSETWSKEHKVLNVYRMVKDADGHKDGFSIDLVTNTICG